MRDMATREDILWVLSSLRDQTLVAMWFPWG